MVPNSRVKARADFSSVRAITVRNKLSDDIVNASVVFHAFLINSVFLLELLEWRIPTMKSKKYFFVILFEGLN